MSNKLPAGLIKKGSSATFTDETIPQSLLEEHSLAANRWGLLNLVDGAVVFVNLETGDEHALTAPTTFPIEPKLAHRLRFDSPFKLHIDFYKPPGP